MKEKIEKIPWFHWFQTTDKLLNLGVLNLKKLRDNIKLEIKKSNFTNYRYGFYHRWHTPTDGTISWYYPVIINN